MHSFHGELTRTPTGPHQLTEDLSKIGYTFHIDTDFLTMVDGEWVNLKRGEIIHTIPSFNLIGLGPYVGEQVQIQSTLFAATVIYRLAGYRSVHTEERLASIK